MEEGGRGGNGEGVGEFGFERVESLEKFIEVGGGDVGGMDNGGREKFVVVGEGVELLGRG